MKNILWILHSVFTLFMYCVFFHYTFNFVITFNSALKLGFLIFYAFSSVALFLAVLAWIAKNYDWFGCDLFNT